jgi:hypothetical protein
MNYKLLKKYSDSLAKETATAIDNEFGYSLGKVINKPTKYIHRGRPKKSDYGLLENTFTGQIRRFINY